MPDHVPPTLPRILTVPGLDGSGPDHWQTHWEACLPDAVRVELGQWARPHRNSWITRLDQVVRASRRPVLLAAHSLGCIAVAWWAAFAGRLPGNQVVGALLVAPADVDRANMPGRIGGFAPIPMRRLPFPSILVASHDDPWIELDRARDLAARWGSTLFDAGHQGHVNAESGLGLWLEGQRLAAQLMDPAAGSLLAERARRRVRPPMPNQSVTP